MSWANSHIAKLQSGETVSFRPKGNSMRGKIDSGDLVTVSPKMDKLKEGDIVLCKVKGSQYVHLIKAIKKEGDNTLYLIGNNHGGINGWVGRNGIFGKVTKVER